jgi:hypothetical protein
VPKGSIIGMLVNGNNPNSEPETLEVQTAANALGRKVHVIQANSPQEIDGAFASLTQIGAGGVLVNPDPGFMIQRDRIIALAARLGKPAIYYSRDCFDPRQGALLAASHGNVSERIWAMTYEPQVPLPLRIGAPRKKTGLFPQ